MQFSFFQEKSASEIILPINPRKSPFLIYIDDFSIKYIGKNLASSDIASIQSQSPIPKNTPIFYYEIKIVEINQKSEASFGFAEYDFPSNRSPGQTKSSFGFRSDGKLFNNKVELEKSDKKIKNGDIIGCGLNFVKNEIFFTLNGVLTIKKNIVIPEIPIYITISLNCKDDSVRLLFKKKDFVFNFFEFCEKENNLFVETIQKEKINCFDIHLLIINFLQYYGYLDTLKSFSDIFGKNNFYQENLEKKKNIKELIIKGKSLQVFLEIDQIYSNLDGNSYAFLGSQAFIELLKEKKYIESVEFAKNHLKKYEEFRIYNSELKEMEIKSLFSFICIDPLSEPISKSFFSIEQREITYDEVYKGILKKENIQNNSILENILKHLKLMENYIIQI